MDRYGRQKRLAEIGPAGQERIGRAAVVVAGEGLAADVAVRYLAGAGVARLCVRDPALAARARAIAPGVTVEVDPLLPPAADVDVAAFGLRDPAAREVARGAIAALRAIRAAIEGG
jgi:hypothetical protein